MPKNSDALSYPENICGDYVCERIIAYVLLVEIPMGR